MGPLSVPPGLLAQAALGASWAAWVEGVAAAYEEVREEWSLQPDGKPGHGFCSLVVPVRTTSGTPAVLKLGYPDEESEHEHLALQRWQGHGAVRLLRADPHRRAMLLERLHHEDLSGLWDLEACEVVAHLYARLHVPALPRLRTLASYVDRWTAGLASLPREAPVPRRLVEQALSLGRDLVRDGGAAVATIHTDLHYGNVLAGDREPWLAIDPKPVAGDPHYEVGPLLWNRWDEAVESGGVRDAVRRRFHTVVDAAGFDEDRATGWVVVRAVHNVLWALEDAERARRQLTREERDRVTTMVTVAKAVQE